MKENIRDRAKGRAKELKGKFKENVGRATKDRQMESEGKAEKAGGRVRRKIGDVEKVFED